MAEGAAGHSADGGPERADSVAGGVSPRAEGPSERSNDKLSGVSPSPGRRLWLWFCGGGLFEEEKEAPVARVVAGVLVGGLCLAVGLLLVGVILAVARSQVTLESHTAPSCIPGAIARLEPGGYFDLGLIMLLATPLVRVVVLTGLFAWRRTWIFTTMGVIVLTMLALAVLLGLVWG